MDAEDIDTTGPAIREGSAALKFFIFLDFLEENIHMASLIAHKYYRANDRILATEDSHDVVVLTELFGNDDKFLLTIIMYALGYLCHLDRYLIPDIRIDLNTMSQADSINCF